MTMIEKKRFAITRRYLTKIWHLKYKLTRLLQNKKKQSKINKQSRRLHDILEDSKKM